MLAKTGQVAICMELLGMMGKMAWGSDSVKKNHPRLHFPGLTPYFEHNELVKSDTGVQRMEAGNIFGRGGLRAVKCGGQGPAWSGVCGEVWCCVCAVPWTSRRCGVGGHVVYAVGWWSGGIFYYLLVII